jgi:hypothetical protein
VNVAVFIAHELKIRDRNCNRLRADTQKASDVDDRGAAGARPVDMIDLADLVIVGSIDGGTFEDGRVSSEVVRRTWLVWSMIASSYVEVD